MVNNSTSYTIKLAQFEGPFDLLLFFIERDELDIYDIPIAKITDDFLAYVRQMEALNIDLASEFILVAATLMRIKAKLLIPRKEIDEEGNEIDPRDELVARLLEYKSYKSVLEEMRQLEEARGNREGRGNITKELQKIATKALVDIELESINLFKLLKTFQRIVQRMEESKIRAVHKVYRYNHTVRGQQQYLLNTIKVGSRTSFEEVFGTCTTRVEAIITFLAMLELLNMQKLAMVQGLEINNFWLTAHDKADEPEDVVHEEDVNNEEVIAETASDNEVSELEVEEAEVIESNQAEIEIEEATQAEDKSTETTENSPKASEAETNKIVDTDLEDEDE